MDPINLEVHWPDSDGNDALWTLNIQSLDTEEAMIIEMYSGTNPFALIANLTTEPKELKTRDFQAIMWLMKRRAGERYPIEQTPKFDILAFMGAIMDAVSVFQNKVRETIKKETEERAERGLPPKGQTSRTHARKTTSASR